MLLLEKRNHYAMCDRNTQQVLRNKTGKDTSGELNSVLYFRL